MWFFTEIADGFDRMVHEDEVFLDNWVFMLMKENIRLLDLVPLACPRRVVAHDDLQFRLVAELLQVVFPGPIASRVASPAVSAN